MKIEDVKSRYEFLLYLNANNLLNEGVEVGVNRGMHSEQILKTWEGRLLYSIDPYIRKDKEHGEMLYNTAATRLSAFGERSKIIRQTSFDASKLFEDDSLDFCHIDGNHSYKHVLQDCEVWWPKIKTGGVLYGHDYAAPNSYNKGKPWPNTGVKEAVDYFADINKLNIYNDTGLNGEDLSCWYIIK